MAETVRVGIVDDHELVREGIRRVLTEDPRIEVVGEWGSGEQAIQEVPALRPDILVLDSRLPGMSGLDVCVALRQTAPEVRIVVLSAFLETGMARDYMSLGAQGYLLKDVERYDLVHAVLRIARGGQVFDPKVVSELVVPRGGSSLLSPRETQVIKLVARGLSNSEIAAHLVVGETTVKTHVSHVLDKLGLRDRVQAVVLAYELGLVSPGVAER
jgi:DNA-binding NarL/FixJ family response regulator